MFTPLHCSLPFPTFGILPGHIALPLTAVVHTFVQPLCLLLFRLLNALLFAVSLTAQSNDCSGTGVECGAFSWHQTRRPVEIPSLIRLPRFPNNLLSSLLLTISSLCLVRSLLILTAFIISHRPSQLFVFPFLKPYIFQSLKASGQAKLTTFL